MRKFIRRIRFYIRYEMDCYVKMRIELGAVICTMLLCIGFAGYQLYTLHRIGQEAEERREAFSEEMKYFIELSAKEKHHVTDSVNYARYFMKRFYPHKRRPLSGTVKEKMPPSSHS